MANDIFCNLGSSIRLLSEKISFTNEVKTLKRTIIIINYLMSVNFKSSPAQMVVTLLRN